VTHRTSNCGPFVLGIVGGIGSGKSRVAAEFAAIGWLVVDFDAKVRKALSTISVRDTLVDWWGEKVLDRDGNLDRKAVASIVFKDAQQRERLESLLHPMVLLTRDQAQQLARDADAPGVVLDAPLLFESGQDRACDAVVFVETSHQTRLNRVMDHRGWSPDDLRTRESSQMPLTEKRARSTHIIQNEPGNDDLSDRVAALSAILLS
jgi:dephospho-CoA kinase